MGKGRRYDDTPKLNIKKVIATILIFCLLIFGIYYLNRKPQVANTSVSEFSSLMAYFSLYKDGKWGVINSEGKVIIEPTYEEMIVVPNKNKDIFICTTDVDYVSNSYKVKVINSKGEEILTEYENISAFDNTDGSKAWYEDDILKFSQNGKFGLINFAGKIMLSADFDAIYSMPNTHKSLIVEKDGKKGVVSSGTGEVIVEVKYDSISAIEDNYEYGYIVGLSGKYGVVSLDKKNVVEVKYDEIKNIYGNGYYVVVENKKVKIINSLGKEIISDGFDNIKAINAGDFIVEKNGKYGILNKNGEQILNYEYDDLKFISSDYYIAKQNGKYGIISNLKETKIEFIYEDINYIKIAGIIEAENSNYTTDLYDINLNKKLEQIYVSEINTEKGYIRISKNNEYYYYNFKFELKTNIDLLSTNTLFLFKENGKYGYKNKNGEVIVDPVYDDAKEQNSYGYFAVKKNGFWGVLSSNGSILLSTSVDLTDYIYVDFIGKYHLVNDAFLLVYE